MVTREVIESVECPRCGAKPGECCDMRLTHPGGGKHKPYHMARAKVAEETK